MDDGGTMIWVLGFSAGPGLILAIIFSWLWNISYAVMIMCSMDEKINATARVGRELI